MSSTLVKESDCLIVNWKTEGKYKWSRFHYPWLRGSCRCPECYSTLFHERQIPSTSFQYLIYQKPESVNYSEDDCILSIIWEDGHKSSFTEDWLVKNTYEHNEDAEPPKTSFYSSVSVRDRTIEPVVFSNDLGVEAPKVDYNSLLKSDETYIEWSDKFERYGFCLVENSPLDELAQRKLVERIGQL